METIYFTRQLKKNHCKTFHSIFFNHSMQGSEVLDTVYAISVQISSSNLQINFDLLDVLTSDFIITKDIKYDLFIIKRL